MGGQEADSLLSGLNLVFTPYTIWPLPRLPIGTFLMLPAVGSGLVLSNIEETMKALPLATTPAVLSGLLTVYFFSIPFPGVSQQGYAQAAFFGTVALPLFLIGLVGGIFGTIAGVILISLVKGKPW